MTFWAKRIAIGKTSLHDNYRHPLREEKKKREENDTFSWRVYFLLAIAIARQYRCLRHRVAP